MQEDTRFSDGCEYGLVFLLFGLMLAEVVGLLVSEFYMGGVF